MIPDKNKLPEQFNNALNNSFDFLKEKLLAASGVEFEEEYNSNIPNIHIFQQSHSNTGGGWETPNQIVGHAFIGFWVIVVEYPILNLACVYIQGIPAYICKMDNVYYDYIQIKVMPLWNQTVESKLILLWRH